jgi:hypothetical protein
LQLLAGAIKNIRFGLCCQPCYANEIIAMLDNMGVEELRSAVVNDPRNAELRYLLGAEMAQQQDYNGAVMEMSAAIALNPTLHTARLQLGLLHLTMARPDHTVVVLAPLEELPDSAALKYFKRGLEALIRDDFAGCTANLQKGIELNEENAPLNKDMAMLMDKVAALVASQPGTATDSPDNWAQERPAVHTDFSLYNATKN